MFFTLTFSPLKINLTHIFGDEFYEFAYNSCTILRLMLTFSPYLFSRFRRYLLRSVPSSICLLDTKSSKKSNVTTDVCQFSRRKVGGYDCQAKYCIKRFKNVESGSTNGLILVEKAASVHDHAIKDTSEERVYHLSTKLINSIIMECIKDCMLSRATKAKLAQKNLLRVDADTAEGRRRIRQKFYRYVNITFSPLKTITFDQFRR